MDQILDVMPHLQDVVNFSVPSNFQGELRIPAVLLRFTQKSFSSKACFRFPASSENRRSMYETLDQLVRGIIEPSDLPPLEVVQHHDKLWSVDNRRLQVLKWFQACHQDKTVWVCCKITRLTKRFWDHWDTTSDGLSICPRLRTERSAHLGASLFNPAAQGMHAIHRFCEKHPSVGTQFLLKVKKVVSKRRPDVDTITRRSCSTAITRDPKAAKRLRLHPPGTTSSGNMDDHIALSASGDVPAQGATLPATPETVHMQMSPGPWNLMPPPPEINFNLTPIVMPEAISFVDPVAAFLTEYRIDPKAVKALRAMPLVLQHQIIGEGPVIGTNTSAVLTARMRKIRMRDALSASASALADGTLPDAASLTAK